MTPIIRLFLVILALVPWLGAGPAAAQEAPGEVVQATMLGGWLTPDGTHMAALSLRLEPGWKTYWRAPGEGGIPPRFDWAGSRNLASVRFHWPRPSVFDVGGLRAIGYADALILPIEITPVRAGDPIRLAATVEIGVCREVCVPVDLRLSLVLPPAGGAADPSIRAALAQVPPLGRAGALRCAVEPLRDGLRVTAEVEAAGQGAGEVAVVEIADRTIWVSQTEMVRQGGRLTATADLVPGTGAPFLLDRSKISLTVLGDAGAIEFRGCRS